MRLASGDRRDDYIDDEVGNVSPSEWRASSYAHPSPCRTKQDEFPVSIDEFPVPAKQIRCCVQNRESSAAPWNCSANGRQNPAESAEMVENFKNSLFFSLF
jgi:hypothetical protein